MFILFPSLSCQTSSVLSELFVGRRSVSRRWMLYYLLRTKVSRLQLLNFQKIFRKLCYLFDFTTVNYPTKRLRARHAWESSDYTGKNFLPKVIGSSTSGQLLPSQHSCSEVHSKCSTGAFCRLAAVAPYLLSRIKIFRCLKINTP